jgi:asparagine synthetase B (glutamine-hydrolysing)
VEADELDRFDELMAQAVRRPLELGPSGLFLSGGLDSVSVAAVAADESRREGREPPLGLSIVFPTAEANEEQVQRGVAASLGLEHLLLPFDDAVGPRGVLAAALELSASWPAPLANIWYPAYRSLTEAAAGRGTKVILTGGGGDEWLGVTPFLAADLMRAGDLRGLYRLWNTMHRSYRLSRLATLRSVLWTFGARPLVAAGAARYAPAALGSYRRRRQRRLTPEWVAPEGALRRELLERAEALADPRAPQGFYLKEGQLSLEHALISMEMEELHESARRTGVPVRMPFWDADLVDFLYRTPPELLTEGGRAKGLVRRMLERRFPELGFERHKKVLAVNFFAQIVYEEGPRVWRELGGAQALERAGVVDRLRLNSLVGEVFQGRRPGDTSLVWNLLSLEAWVRARLLASGEVKK